MAVQVYREIADPSPTLLQWLEERDQLYPVIDDKGKERLYVENDFPRDADISEELVGGRQFPGCTVGFALFDDDGNFIGSYRSLDRALAAQASARVVVSAEVDVEPDGDDV